MYLCCVIIFGGISHQLSHAKSGIKYSSRYVSHVNRYIKYTSISNISRMVSVSIHNPSNCLLSLKRVILEFCGVRRRAKRSPCQYIEQSFVIEKPSAASLQHEASIVQHLSHTPHANCPPSRRIKPRFKSRLGIRTLSHFNCLHISPSPILDLNRT